MFHDRRKRQDECRIRSQNMDRLMLLHPPDELRSRNSMHVRVHHHHHHHSLYFHFHFHFRMLPPILSPNGTRRLRRNRIQDPQTQALLSLIVVNCVAGDTYTSKRIEKVLLKPTDLTTLPSLVSILVVIFLARFGVAKTAKRRQSQAQSASAPLSSNAQVRRT